jgi:hypothetical protein
MNMYITVLISDLYHKLNTVQYFYLEITYENILVLCNSVINWFHSFAWKG